MKYSFDTKSFMLEQDRTSMLCGLEQPFAFAYNDHMVSEWMIDQVCEIEELETVDCELEVGGPRDIVNTSIAMENLLFSISFARAYHDAEKHGFDSYHEEITEELVQAASKGGTCGI